MHPAGAGGAPRPPWSLEAQPMFDQLYRRSKTAGLPPGSLKYVGRAETRPAVIEMITYGVNDPVRTTPETLAECSCYDQGPQVTWVNIDGLHDLDLVAKAGEVFKIHPLVLEDIVHTGQRPKIEDLAESVFVVLKMLRYNETERRIEDEQVSFVLGRHYLLTFQEMAGGDVFGDVRNRILAAKGKVNKLGPDYLMYALIDSIVDNYFVVLERIGEDIEEVEERLLAAPTPKELENIHGLRREALFLRKYIWPLREVVARLEKGGSDYIEEATIFYLRDLYDHTIQVMDTVETFRDMLSGILDLYLSNISLKMNEVMKVLTMFSAFFIPLTFLAGLYGMNFKYMPELEWQYGYFGLLGVMACVAGGMLLYFRRKGWIGGKKN